MIGVDSQQAAPDAATPPRLDALAATLHQRHLATPALLLLASHRPLTFVTGQLLFLLAPLCALLGWTEVNHWATLLSAPDASARLTTILAPPGPDEVGKL